MSRSWDTKSGRTKEFPSPHSKRAPSTLAILLLMAAVAAGCLWSNSEPKKAATARKPPSAPSRASDPKPSPKPAARLAKSLDEVANAIVKLETPIKAGSVIGSGFLIDDRGWIATTHHVAVQLSSASWARFAGGEKMELAGIIAAAPDRDLAIVKLKTPPAHATLLDIGYRDRPPLGTKVYTYGHPLNSDFLLCSGIVSRVATTAELLAEQPRSIPAQIHSPADAVWIETDAKMLPGNSGGPLLDEKCRVLGVNTFISPKVAIGYASYVKYLKDLADKSVDKPSPLPAAADIMPRAVSPGLSPVPGPKLLVSKDKMQRLFDAATALHWRPTNPEQYQTLKNLALMMTVCKAQHGSAAMADFADGLFDRIKEVKWDEDQARAVNLYAASEMRKIGQGAIFVGTMVGRGKDPTGKETMLAFQIPGLSDLLLVPAREGAGIPQGSRMLVLGIILPKSGKGQIAGRSESQALRLIDSGYMLLLK